MKRKLMVILCAVMLAVIMIMFVACGDSANSKEYKALFGDGVAGPTIGNSFAKEAGPGGDNPGGDNPGGDNPGGGLGDIT